MLGLESLIGIGAGVGGSVAGAMEKGSARDNAQALVNASINELTAIGVPPEEAMRVSLEKYKSAGILTPEMESDILQGRTELEGINQDPQLLEAQMNALSELQNIGQGGVRLSDKAATEKILDEVAQQERGSREAIEQDLRQRGAYGSGAELAMKLSNQQNAAQMAHSEGLNLAAQAQDRALQGLIESGKLGGQIDQQQFAKQARIKEAQDAINRMNTAARTDVQQRNVASRNMAQQYNLGNAQNIMNANVDQSNKQSLYNTDAKQNYFNNQLNLAGAKSNARSGAANNLIAGGQDRANLWGGVASAASQPLFQAQSNRDSSEARQKELDFQRDENEKDRAAGVSRRVVPM